MTALSTYVRISNNLVNVIIDDEDHTSEWLQRGRVIAALAGIEKQPQRCRRTALGSMRYRATASPEFVEQHFPAGVNSAVLRTAPALTFNQKDKLQNRWIAQVFQEDVACPTHYLPSTQAVVDASIAGMGWGMNPATICREKHSWS